jgi:hypothetical protein
MNCVLWFVYYRILGARGGVVVKALRYKPAGRVRFPVVSLEFFGDIILPVALWPWGRPNLQQKWVPGVFLGSKGGRCVSLTTLPPSCVVVMKSGNLNFLEPSGPLQACNGTALPLKKMDWGVHHERYIFGTDHIFTSLLHHKKAKSFTTADSNFVTKNGNFYIQFFYDCSSKVH